MYKETVALRVQKPLDVGRHLVPTPGTHAAGPTQEVTLQADGNTHHSSLSHKCIYFSWLIWEGLILQLLGVWLAWNHCCFPLVVSQHGCILNLNSLKCAKLHLSLCLRFVLHKYIIIITYTFKVIPASFRRVPKIPLRRLCLEHLPPWSASGLAAQPWPAGHWWRRSLPAASEECSPWLPLPCWLHTAPGSNPTGCLPSDDLDTKLRLVLYLVHFPHLSTPIYHS